MDNRMLRVSLVVAGLCCSLMVAVPGSETVPYHVAWATFALCYGLEPWSPRATWFTMSAFTAATGAILVYRASGGVLDWQETSEVPLMLTLMLLMVWHVRRRQATLAAVTALTERERAAARSRELLTQRTSHEMRSPLTIARGYLEAVTARDLAPDLADDLQVVDEELARLTRVCDRLVRSLRITGDLEVSHVDVDGVLRQTAERWATVADRAWGVDGHGGLLWWSAERLRACLDTLVENALRYTRTGDSIELYAQRRSPGLIAIGIRDSGPGFAPEVIASVDAAVRWREYDGSVLVRDELSQTGLGISLVSDVARRRGGHVELGTSDAGGADVVMVLPVDAPVHPAAALIARADAPAPPPGRPPTRRERTPRWRVPISPRHP